jgi:hypothetical protein
MRAKTLVAVAATWMMRQKGSARFLFFINIDGATKKVNQYHTPVS